MVKAFLCMTAVALVTAGGASAQSAPTGPAQLLQKSVGDAVRAAAGAAATSGETAATPEEAQRLTALFGRYLGQAAVGRTGVVSVVPNGQSYKVMVGLTRIVPPPDMPAPFDIKTGSYVAMLTPQPDGTWHVTSDELPPLSVTMPEQSVRLRYDGFKFDGIFDPKLSAFRSSTSRTTGIDVESVSPKAAMQTQYGGTNETVQTSRDAGNGTVDTTLTQTITDFAYKLAMTSPATEPDGVATAVNVDAHAAKVVGEGTVAGLPAAHLLDLWAFLVAHPSKELLVASQAELKGLLLSLLPLAGASGKTDIQSLVVNTPEGTVGFGTLSEQLDLGGAVGKDGVHLAFDVSGLTLPDGLTPPWADGLVPTGMSLDTTVGPVHVNDALLKLIAAFNLGADDPITDQQGAEITQTLGSPDQILVSVGPSTITTPLMSLKFQGTSHYDVAAGAPVGEATISATGLDTAVDTLATRAKTAPEAAQALTFLVGMKQLATAEAAGTYSWKVAVAPGGAVTVNGKSMDQQPKQRKKTTTP